MSEPGEPEEEVRFACIGCGTWNVAGAEACAGCGHRFGGPDLVPRIALPPRPPLNPYEAPAAPIAPHRTFRIGTGLFLIAVVAVCLAALRSSRPLGVLFCVSLAPAAIRTPMVAGSRRAGGWPMGLPEQAFSFLATVACTWAVVVSAAIAFAVTCVPTGLAGGNVVVGIGLGGVAAAAWAVWLTNQFRRVGRQQARAERDIRYR